MKSPFIRTHGRHETHYKLELLWVSLISLLIWLAPTYGVSHWLCSLASPACLICTWSLLRLKLLATLALTAASCSLLDTIGAEPPLILMISHLAATLVTRTLRLPINLPFGPYLALHTAIWSFSYDCSWQLANPFIQTQTTAAPFIWSSFLLQAPFLAVKESLFILLLVGLPLTLIEQWTEE